MGIDMLEELINRKIIEGKNNRRDFFGDLRNGLIYLLVGDFFLENGNVFAQEKNKKNESLPFENTLVDKPKELIGDENDVKICKVGEYCYFRKFHEDKTEEYATYFRLGYAGMVNQETFSMRENVEGEKVEGYRVTSNKVPSWSSNLYYPINTKRIVWKDKLIEVLDVTSDYIKLRQVDLITCKKGKAYILNEKDKIYKIEYGGLSADKNQFFLTEKDKNKNISEYNYDRNTEEIQCKDKRFRVFEVTENYIKLIKIK